MSEDEALIRRAQAGDPQAFECLLERHYDMMYRFAYKWCGNRADAEDVTQQSCMKLARSLGQFRFDAAFSSWLYRVVVNCARDWARSQRPFDDVEPDAQPSGSSSVEQQTYLWQLLERLDDLPDGLKETLLLVHAEGLTHGEAAQVLQVRESTVSWRLHEFRKRFGTLLEAGGLHER